MIEAREQILNIQSASYPHNKKSSQEKIFRRLHEQAYPSNFMPKKNMDMEGFARMLSK